VGDWGIENNMAYTSTAAETGKKVAIIGGRPCRLGRRLPAGACAGHGVTIFDEHEELGGMDAATAFPVSGPPARCSMPKSSASSTSAWKPA